MFYIKKTEKKYRQPERKWIQFLTVVISGQILRMTSIFQSLQLSVSVKNPGMNICNFYNQEIKAIFKVGLDTTYKISLSSWKEKKTTKIRPKEKSIKRRHLAYDKQQSVCISSYFATILNYLTVSVSVTVYYPFSFIP